jgi:hypothetical protein
MKKVILIFQFCFILIFSGCSKSPPADEITVKKNQVENPKRTKIEEDEDSHVKIPAGKNSELQTITSEEVKMHIGDSVCIKGYVADVYLSDKVAYLNFENKFPKNLFACTIFSGKFGEFGDLSKYKDRNVEVTGRITTYKSKPQVILETKNQIKIIQ